MVKYGNDMIGKLISDINKNDYIWDPIKKKYFYTILVESKNSRKNLEMIKIKDTLITFNHPIYVNDKWYHPIIFNNSDNKIVFIDRSVYNLVLMENNDGEMGCSYQTEDGLICCSLGHGLKGDIIEHDFYGTYKVINELKILDINGFSNQHVIISSNIKLDNNGNVCGLKKYIE